jgi:hypothetical protein
MQAAPELVANDETIQVVPCRVSARVESKRGSIMSAVAANFVKLWFGLPAASLVQVNTRTNVSSPNTVESRHTDTQKLCREPLVMQLNVNQ